MTLHQVTGKIYIPLDIMIPHIMALGMEEMPHEACGLIVPDTKTAPINWVMKMINRADNPFNSYRLDPDTINQLQTDHGRDDPVWEDVVVWHTHPSGSVGPSRGDLDNRVEGLKYLVVSLPNGEAVFF